MHPTPSVRSFVPLLIIGCSAASLATGAFGQGAAKPSDSEVVVMSPFDVNAAQDKGYLSTSSAAITRLAAPVKDLPVDVMIINPDVISDLGHTSLYDFGRFIVGSNDHGSAGQWTFDMRGFNSAGLDDTQRDGFRFTGRPNVYNIDRIEIIMGPNSVVQGAADPGGQVNVITKSAQVKRQFTTFTGQVGSFSSWRAAIDSNQSAKIGDQDLAIRVNAVCENGATFVKFSKDQYRGIAVAGKDELWGGKTVVEGKFEYLHEERVPWNNLIDRWSGGPGLNGGFDIALNRQIPKLYNYNEANALEGPDSLEKRDGTYLEGQLTHRFSDTLNFLLVGQTGTEKAPFYRQGGVSPSVSYIAATNSYVDNRAWTWAVSNDRRYNMRALLNYDLRLGWMDQQMIAGFSYLSVRYSGYQDNLFSTATSAAVVDQTPLFPGGVTAANYGLNMTGRYWKAQAANSDHVDSPSYYLNSTGSYFNGKIKTVVGYSWNSADRTDYFYAAPAGAYNDHTASVPTPTRSVAYSVKAPIPMISVIFAVTPEINLYADYSKSFKPQTVYYPTLDLTTGAQTGSLGPITGVGYEGGVKFDFSKVGLTGSIAGYSCVEQNIAAVLDTNIVAGLLGVPASLSQRYYVPGTAQTDKGLEVQLFYSPTPELSFMVNYAYSSGYITRSDLLPAVLGQEANVHFKQMANALMKYTWMDGPMKGWFLGANGFARGREWRIQSIEYGTNAGYGVLGGLAGYSGKWGSTLYTAQVNVDNVFNKIYLRTYAMVGEPRQFSVSLNVKF